MEKLQTCIFALNKFFNRNLKFPLLTSAVIKILKNNKLQYNIHSTSKCVKYRHSRRFLKCSSLKPYQNSCRNNFLQHFTQKNPAVLFKINSLQFSTNPNMTPIVVESQADLKTLKPHTLFCYVYNNPDGVLNPAVCTRYTENESHYSIPGKYF